MIVPDSIEPYIGYKCLKIVGGHLRSLAFPTDWPPAQKLTAVCHNGPYHPHGWPSPAELCGCGIYAVDTVGAASYYFGSGRVMIKVALWGKTVMGTTGARAQYAYPQEIVGWHPETAGKIAQVARVYQIPVRDNALVA